MDEKIEVVSNDGLATVAEFTPEVDAGTNKAVTYGAIAAGAAIAVTGGILLWKFVIKPAIKKHKEKKAAETEVKTEEDAES